MPAAAAPVEVAALIAAFDHLADLVGDLSVAAARIAPELQWQSEAMLAFATRWDATCSLADRTRRRARVAADDARWVQATLLAGVGAP